MIILVHLACDWIIDSRCSNHVTSHREILDSLHNYTDSNAIAIANNSLYSIKKIGDLSLRSTTSTSILVNSVYYIANMKKNNLCFTTWIKGILFYMDMILWRFMLMLKYLDYLLLKAGK